MCPSHRTSQSLQVTASDNLLQDLVAAATFIDHLDSNIIKLVNQEYILVDRSNFCKAAGLEHLVPETDQHPQVVKSKKGRLVRLTTQEDR